MKEVLFTLMLFLVSAFAFYNVTFDPDYKEILKKIFKKKNGNSKTIR